MECDWNLERHGNTRNTEGMFTKHGQGQHNNNNNNNVLDLQLWLDRETYPTLCIWWMGIGEEEYP